MKRRRGPGETNHTVAHAARLLRTTSAKVRKLISEGKLEWTQEREGGPIKVNARSLADYMGFASRAAGKREDDSGGSLEPATPAPEPWSFLDSPGAVTLDIPQSDHWVIAAMANAVARRIVEIDEPRDRRAIWLQILWSLQRLPKVERGTSWTISAGCGEDSLMLRLYMEGLDYARFDTGTTIVSLHYDSGGNRFAQMYVEPSGREREEALQFQMQSIAEYLEDPAQEVNLEFYGPGFADDEVPLQFGEVKSRE